MGGVRATKQTTWPTKGSGLLLVAPIRMDRAALVMISAITLLPDSRRALAAPPNPWEDRAITNKVDADLTWRDRGNKMTFGWMCAFEINYG
mmetsp:Transcript_2070/g.4941  ORF Transcript_2070/g.4941 Transcript_2070/m.4941 type:complete len:91 (-) Transcript_2070:815-1087(-)